VEKIVIHWLYPKRLLLSDVENSHLASLRLRAAIASRKFSDRGYSVSFGEFIPDGTNILFVPKIGADNIDTRAPLWLDLIRQARYLGAKIVIDYTDHHLGFASPMRHFYAEALTLSDSVTVPSDAMRKNLLVATNIQALLIPDSLEYNIRAPQNRRNKKSRLIWFGHGSNLRFLLSFLNENDLRKRCEVLSIVTSIEGINWLAQQSQRVSLPRIKLIPWSKESLSRAARCSDLALLPVGVHDPSKSGASANRLITALALGLPVVTQSLLSYQDYRDFYTDIDNDRYLDVIEYPWGDHVRVLKAQDTVVPQYLPERIGGAWLKFILDMLDSKKVGNHPLG
jgi:hypothetical protein